jgi:acyl-CoA synthetase (AMP-forming)/AMP-acid ligase II
MTVTRKAGQAEIREDRLSSVLPGDDVLDLDLSSWRVAFNGAEPVDGRTLRQFAARFAVAGFRTQTLYPVYGLAEHTLAVSFPPLGHQPIFDSVDRDVLAATSVVRSVSAEDPAAVTFVCVGRPLGGVLVEIRTGDAREPDGHVGEIVVKSGSVMTGYFENASATADAIADGWLKTGDLGYMRDGFLYVTGRKKDLIIRAGCNYYPQDIEGAASDVPGVKPGRVVSFSMDVDGEEQVVVLLEVSAAEADVEISNSVASAVAARVGFRPERVVVCDASTLPMTSSGKVQRTMAKERFLSGALGPQRG